MTTTTSTTSSTTSSPSTGSTIISAIGSGSGLDTASLVTKLVDVSKMSDTARIATKKTLLETQISDYGLIRSAFSKLETAASALSNSDTFNAKSASVPTTTLMAVTKLDAKASIGDYRIAISTIAQSQSLSSTTFSSQTATIGKGTLAIRLGTWDDPPTAFTADSTKTGATITIDDSNNSLTGLRDAINKSTIGVKASIVSDGGNYRLMVTAPSGATNEVEITATETSGAAGLASFNFNQTTRNLTQQQGGVDASIRVNGLLVTRSTNHLTDVIEGLEFDLNNSSTTETVNIGISQDKTISEKAIRDFVSGYNTFLSDTAKLTGFNKDTNEYGSLRQDPLAKNLLQQVRAQLGTTIAGLTNNFTSLSSLGIHTELDGTLTIDDSTAATSFRSSIDNNFESVRDLFVPKTASNSAQIAVTKYSNVSVAGTYDVNITTQPTKGSYTGGTLVSTFPLDASAKNFTFTAKIDGVSASPITLSATTYATGAALAVELQTKINMDTNLVAAKASVNVSYNSSTNKFEFTSAAYGSSSAVSFSALSSDMADLGITTASGTQGTDVAGTINGKAAFGSGDVLLPALNTSAEGLSMKITPGATTGKISFSRGFAGTFTNLIDGFLKTNGLIKARETNISKEVDKTKTDQAKVDRKAESYRARLQSQFGAMESIVRSLKATGTFLTGALANLPFTSKNN